MKMTEDTYWPLAKGIKKMHDIVESQLPSLIAFAGEETGEGLAWKLMEASKLIGELPTDDVAGRDMTAAMLSNYATLILLNEKAEGRL